MPQISVLIPVYNAGKYLPVCLESVRAQTLTDIEIICMDDGSTDNSAAVLREFAAREPRLKISTQKNAGVAVTRNRLMHAAQGKYLAFIDADDTVAQTYLEQLYQAAETSGADITKCFFQEIREDGKQIFPAHCSGGFYKKPSEFLADRFRAGYQDAVVWGKLWRRDWLNSQNLSFFPGRIAEDLPFVVLAFMVAGKIAIVPECLYYYRKGIVGAITANNQKMAVDILRNLIDVRTQLHQRHLTDPYVSYRWVKSMVWSIARFRKFSGTFNQQHQALLKEAWQLIRRETEECFFCSRVRWKLMFGLVRLCGWRSVYVWTRLFR